MASTIIHSSDVYRLYLQAVMSRRIMTEAVAKALWKACTDAVARAAPTKNIEFVDGQNEWNLFLDKIKRLLDPLDLEFARCKDEDTAVVVYAITNTKGDEVAQLASDYNPTEIAFFKAIVQQIILAPKHAYSVSSLAALRELSHLKGPSMTKTQGEVILASFVARGWLVRSKRGRYSLGTRSISELSTYIKNTYDETDVLECVTCMELVTKGYMCPTANCTSPLHKHCYEMYRRRNVCPKCQQDWGEGHEKLIPIGEEAVKDGQPEHRRVRRTSGGDGEENEVVSQEMSQSQPPQSQSQSRSQKAQSQVKKGKSKKAPVTKANGKSKKRATTPETEEEDQLDDMYDDDKDDTIDIDDLAAIREKPSGRNRRH